MAATPFKRSILRAVLRDVHPMVIRLVAVPDSLDVTNFDDIFHTVLGRESGIGYSKTLLVIKNRMYLRFGKGDYRVGSSWR